MLTVDARRIEGYYFDALAATRTSEARREKKRKSPQVVS
jgi:hypothetical protein